MTALPRLASVDGIPTDPRADIFRSREPANVDKRVADIMADDDLYQLCIQRRMGHELDDHEPHILAALNKRIAELS